MREYLNITNEDNLDLMKRFEDNHFDLAIVDPPYGLDLANMNMGIGKSKKASKAKNRKWKNKDWDKNTPTEEYFKELFRVSKNQIIWGGNYFDLPPCKHYLIWDKEIPNGLSFADCEFAWTSFDKAPRIFRYSAYLDKKTKFHPTQKPKTLYQYILTNYAKEGFKVLDTHLGSGNIAIALDGVNKIEKMNLTLDACEIDKEYFDKATNSIIENTKWNSLF
ncbi:site-specific DNA-methyltransferase [Winogradskyella sp. F6397]|uniref:site-specific DNA-methyltransferase (adenine-specific) n=1 Tax=Winogradskyella marina TaxID=2785530 RepID=A0ABS0EN52_9FLAO|nr:DNA methyltransferase [Winogradskyella marina]MBF8151561.1 site-specific DNA-methyltransferase [Winogradskyella marina]